MLEHLRQQVECALADSDVVFLSSYGPAGLQASVVTARAVDLVLYLEIPYSSDHLGNLLEPAQVVACTSGWELHGVAALLPPDDSSALTPAPSKDAEPTTTVNDHPGSRTAILRPTRLTIRAPSGCGNLLTIDL